ncbi:MAG: hypothetical protein ACOCRO_05915 [Halanaerobiales bacterium]
MVLQNSYKWNTMLYNRGFVNVVNKFLNILKKDIPTKAITEDALKKP